MRNYVEQTWGWEDLFQRKRFDEQYASRAISIIQVDGERVGCIHVERTPQEFFLASIEVAPSFQNRGIGTRLVTDITRESDEKKIPTKLFVLKVNPSRRLYERLGFRAVEETATHYIMRRETA